MAMSRAMMHYFFIRDYNVDLAEAKKAKLTNKIRRNKAVRVKDKELVFGFAKYMDQFVEGVGEMEDLEGHKAKLQEIVIFLKYKETKTSAVKSMRKVSSFEKVTKKRQSVIAAEKKVDGVYFPPWWESG
jgi:ribosomal protein S8